MAAVVKVWGSDLRYVKTEKEGPYVVRASRSTQWFWSAVNPVTKALATKALKKIMTVVMDSEVFISFGCFLNTDLTMLLTVVQHLSNLCPSSPLGRECACFYSEPPWGPQALPPCSLSRQEVWLITGEHSCFYHVKTSQALICYSSGESSPASDTC